MQVRDLALEFGGRERNGAIIVPATSFAEFLAAAHDRDIAVGYIECLYLGPGFTEPSMELSRELTDFGGWEAFVAFATEAAREAASRAGVKGAEAVFEVGP